MRSFRLTALLAAAAVFLAGCSWYDDSGPGIDLFGKSSRTSSSSRAGTAEVHDSGTESRVSDLNSISGSGELASEVPDESTAEIREDDLSLSYSTRYYLDNMKKQHLKDAAMMLIDGLKKHQEKIYFTGLGLTKDELREAYDLALSTEPDIGWVSLNYNYYYDVKGRIINCRVDYTLDKAKEDKLLQKLHKQAEDLVSETEGMDDFDRIVYFHDRLISGCVYDSSNPNAWSAYGCLIDGRAVCEGYSKAFQLLCDTAGVPCLIINGVTNDETETLHMWNKVQMDGEWYNMDLTWDDPEGSKSSTDIAGEAGLIHYEYFGDTDQAASVEHKEVETLYMKYPPAEATYDNYYIRMGLWADKNTENSDDLFYTAAKYFLDRDIRAFQIGCSDWEVYEDLCIYEFDEGGIFHTLDSLTEQGYRIDNTTYNYTEDDENLVITVIMKKGA